ALSVADRAVAAALDPLEALAVRARLRGRAGELPGARADVDRALILRPDDPGLLELRGRLEIAAGRLEVGLADLDRALCFGAGGSARAERARVGMALDRPEEALDDWSRVVADAPDDPDALLGRARAFVRLRLWDQALADLERAAGRSAPGSPGFGRITRTYAACLLGRPDRLPRVFALALRWGLARFVPAP
ncbi:MAG TPA: tetratricopeptide repeat protein, partial [Isosphaeraceae bacterium]